MDTFKLFIDTNNAAFQPDSAPEVARLLRDAADKIDRYAMWDTVKLFDINGNYVGNFGMKAKRRTRNG